MSGIFKSMQISASGLSAQRQKMNAVSSNIANIETSKTPEGGPYKRKRVTMSETKEPQNFVNIMQEQTGQLVTTNPRHIPAGANSSFKKAELSEVKAKEEANPDQPVKLIYDPSHPDADEKGYVALPNINVINEMVDMMDASMTYEANLSVMKATKDMASKALDM
ncbi:MAG: flagellar basal body rod protein FlgC [candidate division Zixibacteria bacterium]|nr:flagellar basal body rod protein FlgC [candidate division Zixibacteria bacterium]